MRGSPLFRTLLVLAVLAVTGLGLARLTAPVPIPHNPESLPPPITESTSTLRASYELLLSAAARSVTLEGGGAAVSQQMPAETLAGSIELDDRALIALRVLWADETPGHRFAKLRLDLPGRDSIEHVFTAPGDIDDIWEIEP